MGLFHCTASYNENFSCLIHKKQANTFICGSFQLGNDEFLKFAKFVNELGELCCNGHKQNCVTKKLKWVSSLSETDRNKFIYPKFQSEQN